jgi:hypothetical protein
MFAYLDDGDDPFPTYEAALVAEREAKYRNGRRFLVSVSVCLMLVGAVTTVTRHMNPAGPTSTVARVTPADVGVADAPVPGDGARSDRGHDNAKPANAKPPGDSGDRRVPGGAATGTKPKDRRAVVVVPSHEPAATNPSRAVDDPTSTPSHHTTPGTDDPPPIVDPPYSPPPSEFAFSIALADGKELVAGDPDAFGVSVHITNPTDHWVSEKITACDYLRWTVRGNRLEPDLEASAGCYEIPINLAPGEAADTMFFGYLPADLGPGTYTVLVPFTATVQVTVVAAG